MKWVGIIVGILLIILLVIYGSLKGMKSNDFNYFQEQWKILEQHQTTSGDKFDSTLVANLPPLVQRYFFHAIALNTPLSESVELGMDGQFLLGAASNWLPLTAAQILVPSTGFIWRADIGAAGMKIEGYDAISWWTMNQEERHWFLHQPGGGDYDAKGIMGVCWPNWNAFLALGYVVPEIHSRIVINSEYINSYENKRFYVDNPNRWPAERDSLFRDTMTHEFGHSIGMMHFNDNYIMTQYSAVQSFDTTRADYGKFFFDPAYTPKYSNSNKGQISTKAPQ